MFNFSKVSSMGDEKDIIYRKQTNKIYVGEFPNNSGKYISKVIKADKNYDTKIQISPRIELRLTYIIDKKKITGVKITKVSKSRNNKSISLTTLDSKKILALLKIFSELDLKSIANRSLILDGNIIQDQEELVRFLKTLEKDKKAKETLLSLIENSEILEGEDINQLANKKRAVTKFKKLLNNKNFFKKIKKDKSIGKDEEVWQRFFERNAWLVESDIVEILDERIIDEDNITDVLTQNYNGFIDIIELKLPNKDMWTKNNNPKSELSKALMQCMEYITEMERRMNDLKKTKCLGATILKPRITLIFGRSNNWREEQREQFRILNSSFHNITILTYDHILKRAKQKVAS